MDQHLAIGDLVTSTDDPNRILRVTHIGRGFTRHGSYGDPSHDVQVIDAGEQQTPYYIGWANEEQFRRVEPVTV